MKCSESAIHYCYCQGIMTAWMLTPYEHVEDKGPGHRGPGLGNKGDEMCCGFQRGDRVFTLQADLKSSLYTLQRASLNISL